MHNEKWAEGFIERVMERGVTDTRQITALLKSAALVELHKDQNFSAGFEARLKQAGALGAIAKKILPYGAVGAGAYTLANPNWMRDMGRGFDSNMADWYQMHADQNNDSVAASVLAEQSQAKNNVSQLRARLQRAHRPIPAGLQEPMGNGAFPAWDRPVALSF